MTQQSTVHGSYRNIADRALRRFILKRRQRLPILQSNASIGLRNTLAAWQLAQRSSANAPGDQVAYYSLTFEDVHFPGERPWDPRWAVLRESTSFRGKSVLELGCNVGLLSTSLLNEQGAARAVGVDHDEMIVSAARTFAESYVIRPEFRCVDLVRDDRAVQSLIDERFDVIFCLSVWHWLPDHTLLSRLLSSAPEVIFEGHNDEQTERARLQSLGFSDVTLLAESERHRPLLRATK